MFPIKSLFIPHIELYVDAEFVMNLFYENHIATISRVTFENNCSSYKRAYVDIYEWHDTEIAYNFIKRLKNEQIETKLIHSDDDWWVVQINYKREEFYLNENNTFINYLINNEDTPEDFNAGAEKVIGYLSNQKGRELLAFINGANQRQDNQDWKDIENLIDISLRCFRLEFSY